MDDTFFVEIAQCKSYLHSVKFDLVLLESSSGLKEPIEFTTLDERHDEKQSKIRHKKILHSNQELMLTFEHDIFFKFCVFDLVVLDQNILSYNLYCIKLFVELEFSQEYFTKGTFSEYNDDFEIFERWLSLLIVAEFFIFSHED